MNHFRPALILLTALWVAIARGEPEGVILLEGAEGTGVHSRLQAELTLLEFKVQTSDGRTHPDRFASRSFPPGVVALIEIDSGGLNLWHLDPGSERWSRVRVERTEGMSDELLALRAVELLRGRLLPTRELEPPEPSPSSLDHPERKKGTSSQTKRGRIEAALGVGATATLGLPVAPHLGVGASYLLPYGLSLGPFVELPFGFSEMQFVGGGLSTKQAAYGVALMLSWSPSRLIRWGVSAQVGARSVAFRHQPSPPFSSSSGIEMFPLLGLGIHGVLSPWSWLGVRTELRGAPWKGRDLLTVSNASAVVDIETESPVSTLSAGSQLAAQLSIVGRW